MLTVRGGQHRLCDRVPRRAFLKIGALGGLTLADVLRLQAEQPTDANAAQANRGSRKSVILIFLEGGASHLDTYDLKPAAPAEYRGEFRPIATTVPGFQVCELMPRQAQIAQHISVLRGVRAASPDHVYDEVFTAFPRGTPRAAFGSLVSRFSSAPASGLPAYVGLSRPLPPEQPLYAGAAHAPFRPNPETIADLGRSVSLSCLEERKALLRGIDTLRRDLDDGVLAAMDQHTARAFDILTADQTRQAFDLTQEPEHVRARYPVGTCMPYGTPSTWNASSLLLARRLVERGVRVVTLWLSSWDQHARLFRAMDGMLPLLDQSIFALVTDLRERGMDQDVAVVVLGEFGRTPRINNDAGRDHWNEAGCVVLAGGGLRMGQVIGDTDSRGERSRSQPIRYQNIFATLYHVLGIDPGQTLLDLTGRPLSLLDDRAPIAELV
jgi:uncharacterized protein (DUF1501 family)